MRRIYKFFLGILLICMLLNQVIIKTTDASAAKIVIATGTYVVGDGADENMKLAQERSKANAIRKAVHKAGLYVESYSKAENMIITEDESRYVAGTVMDIMEEEFSPEIVSDNIIRYNTRIKARIDIDGIFRILRQRDRQEIERNMQSYTALLERTKNLEDENERIKQKYTALVWDNQMKQEMNNLLDRNEAEFLTNQMYIESIKLLSKKEYQKALFLVNEALQKKEYEIGYVIRGNINQELGRNIEAISDYTNAIRLNEHLGDAYKNRGCIYDNQGSEELALQDYDKALSLGLNSFIVYKNYGRILMKKGELRQGLIYLTKACYINNQDNVLYGWLGRIQQLLGNQREAIDMFSKAIKLGNNDHHMFYWRGDALEKQEKYAQAINDYRKAIELYPCKDYYLARGNAYSRLGMKNDAAIDYDLAKKQKR